MVASRIERTNEDIKMPDGKIVKVPFLNGGLFDKEEFDEQILTFKSKLFHHPDFEDAIFTLKSNGFARGFLQKNYLAWNGIFSKMKQPSNSLMSI